MYPMNIPSAAGGKPLTDGEDSRTNLVASTIHSKLPELYPRSSRPLKKPVKYMECLKNHAAAIGGNATDGCGEFMAGGKDGTLEALLCSACCCHRNFHRKIHVPSPANSDVKKRFRTKFSQEQKEKMLRFAEKGGWKLQKMDDSEVRRFCHEIGIKRKVLKVWMHNNKYHFANKINTLLTTT